MYGFCDRIDISITRFEVADGSNLNRFMAHPIVLTQESQLITINNVPNEICRRSIRLQITFINLICWPREEDYPTN